MLTDEQAQEKLTSLVNRTREWVRQDSEYKLLVEAFSESHDGPSNADYSILARISDDIAEE